MARNNCPYCDSAYTLCPGHPELNPPQPAEGDGAVAWYVYADTEHWVTDDRDEADKNRSDGCHVRPLIFGDMTRPAATAVVADGFTPSQIEVEQEIHAISRYFDDDAPPSWVTRHVEWLRALTATAPAAPKGGVVDEAWMVKARELYGRCALFPETTADGMTALLELRNHVEKILANPEPRHDALADGEAASA